MMIDAPDLLLAVPFLRETLVFNISTLNFPEDGTWIFGMSPAWPPETGMPCAALVGLKCPLAVLNLGSHFPTE